MASASNRPRLFKNINAKIAADALSLGMRGVAYKGEGWHVVTAVNGEIQPQADEWRVNANCNIRTPKIADVKAFINVSTVTNTPN